MATAMDRAKNQAISQTRASSLVSALRKFNIQAKAELESPGSWAVVVWAESTPEYARFTTKSSLDYLNEAIQAGIDQYIKDNR